MASVLLKRGNHSVKGPIDPLMVEAVTATYDLVDQGFRALVGAGTLNGLNLACQPGCAACCTYIVSTTLPEAELVAQAVQALPDATRAAVIGRLATWGKTYRKAGYGDGPARPAETTRWQVKRIACPMLEPTTRTCLVYADRPNTCRVHHAVYPPADVRPECGRCADEGVALVPPAACFTTPRDAAHGHLTPIFQLRSDLNDRATMTLLRSLMATTETMDLGVGILPLMVLGVGIERYGWRIRKYLALEVVS